MKPVVLIAGGVAIAAGIYFWQKSKKDKAEAVADASAVSGSAAAAEYGKMTAQSFREQVAMSSAASQAMPISGVSQLGATIAATSIRQADSFAAYVARSAAAAQAMAGPTVKGTLPQNLPTTQLTGVFGAAVPRTGMVLPPVTAPVKTGLASAVGTTNAALIAAAAAKRAKDAGLTTSAARQTLSASAVTR